MTNPTLAHGAMPELLPCPFCGGEPTTIERPDNIDGTEFFYAAACYCGGHSACAHKMAIRKTPEQAKSDAIAAWNARAAIQQAAVAVPEGHRIVPIEPAEELLNAAVDVDSYKLGDISPLGFRMSPQQLFEKCYAAMLAAAPARGNEAPTSQINQGGGS